MSTDSNHQVVQDLKAAKAELVARGRAQNGRQIDQDGRVCILGAIGIATGGSVEARLGPFAYRVEQMPAKLALERHIPDGRIAMLYNDDPRTTDQDVLNLFDKALADLGGLGDE